MARPPTGQVLERRGKRGKTFALRFRAYGRREYLTLGSAAEGWTRAKAEEELQNALADVRRGIWQAPAPVSAAAEPVQTQTLHEFASAWVERNRHGVDERTVEFWKWALAHVLEHFATTILSAITVERVDTYKTAKVREREVLEEELRRWQKADPQERGPRPTRPLSNTSINRTLRVLAQVLDDAVEYGHIDVNPARGRKRRLKASRPRRVWLELDEVRSLLKAASRHRALIATLILAGLRVSELCELRWRAVDLAQGKLTVEESKTDAGTGRKVELTPMLLDELKLHRAAARDAGRDDLVFPTLAGTRRDRANVRSRVLLPVLVRANAAREAAGLPPIAHVTNHTLRRTFASLLYEAGANPAEVMDQLGHESAALALEVYAKKLDRNRDTGTRVDALLRGDDWAPMGTTEPSLGDALSTVTTEEAV